MLFSNGPHVISELKVLRRRDKPLIVSAIILCFFIGVLIGQYLGQKKAKFAIENNVWLSAKLVSVLEQNAKQRKKIAVFQSANEIDRLAVRNAQNLLSKLQGELLETRRELAFYRRVISPETKHKSLIIQDFRILKGPDFHYRLALSRGIGKKGIVKGSVQMLFTGKIAGIDREISLLDIAQGQSDQLTFKFRHFRLLTGSFSFPEDFIPESIEIVIESTSKGVEKINKDWLWTDLVGT